MTIERLLREGERFWDSHKENCYLVYYEELTADPVFEVKKICDFIGIQFEAEMLDTQKSDIQSSLINSDTAKISAFYDSSSYDRPIQASEKDKWRSQLNSLQIAQAESYFSRQGIKVLKKYNLDSRSSYLKFVARLSLFLFTLKRKINAPTFN